MATEVEDVDNTHQFVGGNATQILSGGLGGNKGDFLKCLILVPTSKTSGNAVSIQDGTNPVILIHIAESISSGFIDLRPITVTIGAKSTSGPWKVITGSTITVIAVGKFT